MSDQIRISDSGELETVPTTWDGEPLYSPSTVAEGLFDADAFKQVPGQTHWIIGGLLHAACMTSTRIPISPRCIARAAWSWDDETR